MKVIYLFIIINFILNNKAYAWNLIWQDEFNGNKLNETNWDWDEGCDGWGNEELQCYTIQRNENVRVENGHLVINVKVESFKGKKYTSARLTSKQSWAFGKFEARMKMPKGKHLWPAFWMMPKNDVYGGWAASGEIDIMEYRGQKLSTIEATISYGGTDPNYKSSGSEEMDMKVDLSADYHTYGLEWDQNQIRWYFDTKLYHTENIHRSLWSGKGKNPYTKEGQPFDTRNPFYIILNVAVGGNFFPVQEYGELTAETAKLWPKPTLEVDYVKVWKQN